MRYVFMTLLGTVLACTATAADEPVLTADLLYSYALSDKAEIVSVYGMGDGTDIYEISLFKVIYAITIKKPRMKIEPGLYRCRDHMDWELRTMRAHCKKIATFAVN